MDTLYRSPKTKICISNLRCCDKNYTVRITATQVLYHGYMFIRSPRWCVNNKEVSVRPEHFLQEILYHLCIARKHNPQHITAKQ